MGFGATDADWEANHQADLRYQAGTAYNATSENNPNDLSHDDRYFGVIHTNGRVLNYQMRFPPPFDLTTTRQAILRNEFPPDAKILWEQAKFNSCYQMEVQSASLGKIFADPKFGDPQGQVFVQLTTSEPGALSDYHSDRVDEGILSFIAYATPADAGNC